jgi:hypothetical protein
MELEIYEALEQLEIAITDERRKFNNAVRRRNKAMETVSAADAEAMKISGAILALERMHRIMTGTEEKVAIEEKKTDNTPRTLAG